MSYDLEWSRGPYKLLTGFRSIEQCQASYVDIRDRHGLGSSSFSSADVFRWDGASRVYEGTISYNGRLWPCRSADWESGMEPIAESPDAKTAIQLLIHAIGSVSV